MSKTQPNPGRLIFGMVLIAAGGLMLVGQLDLFDFGRAWYRLWPLIPIAIGAAKLVWPDDRDGRLGALSLLLFGLWFGAASWHWWGLTWRNSWPIAVMIGGGMMVLRVLFPGKAGEKGGSDVR